jgi:hypothetical protein
MVPLGEYRFYWVPPDFEIGIAVSANSIGKIPAFTYTVPATTTVGAYGVLARLEGITVAAQAPYQVTP